MATIINSKKSDDGNVIVEVRANYDEYLKLQGHLNDVHLFTEKTACIKTNISQRGRKEATKYFLIPRNLRTGFKFNNSTSCQRIDLKDKVVFVYVIDKGSINPSRKELAIQKIEENYSSG